MLRSLFQKPREEERLSPTRLSGPRVPRHSSGWIALRKHLESESSLRVLDIGPTSPNNINYLTNMGHSVYMSDLVHEAFTGNWKQEPAAEGEAPRWDAEGYLAHNMDFSGRIFDVVLLWTTLDYMPEPLVIPVVERLFECTAEGGRILAMFHTRNSAAEASYSRYHLTPGDEIELQDSEPFSIQRIYTNRNIEKIFSAYSNCKFFLAKDNQYEVIITR